MCSLKLPDAEAAASVPLDVPVHSSLELIAQEGVLYHWNDASLATHFQVPNQCVVGAEVDFLQTATLRLWIIVKHSVHRTLSFESLSSRLISFAGVQFSDTFFNVLPSKCILLLICSECETFEDVTNGSTEKLEQLQRNLSIIASLSCIGLHLFVVPRLHMPSTQTFLFGSCDALCRGRVHCKAFGISTRLTEVMHVLFAIVNEYTLCTGLHLFVELLYSTLRSTRQLMLQVHVIEVIKIYVLGPGYAASQRVLSVPEPLNHSVRLPKHVLDHEVGADRFADPW